MILDVILTEVEKSWAVQLATSVHDSAGKQMLPDGKIDPSKTSKAIDIIGFSGELAFAKLVNQFPATQTDGPSAVDLVVEGKAVDVKTTDRDNGQLLVRPKCRGNSAEIFVLMTGTLDKGFVYHGGLPAAEVFQDKYITDLGHGPTYAIPQVLLNKQIFNVVHQAE